MESVTEKWAEPSPSGSRGSGTSTAVVCTQIREINQKGTKLTNYCVFLPKLCITNSVNWVCKWMNHCGPAARVRDHLATNAPRFHVRHQVHLTSVSRPPQPPCRDWSDSPQRDPVPAFHTPNAHQSPSMRHPHRMTLPHFPLTCGSFCTSPPPTAAQPSLATSSPQGKPPGTEGNPTEAQSERFKNPEQTRREPRTCSCSVSI